ncbi:unnamed protein product [Cuscuta campestris]|uniref:Uncharacterized protein n=1 Tax=Cuscuta campestris TaxID=132261 RepID=A0A484NAE8_9ASTE|nr:unnamed protein product [Cuscuta campestris]
MKHKLWSKKIQWAMRGDSLIYLHSGSHHLIMFGGRAYIEYYGSNSSLISQGGPTTNIWWNELALWSNNLGICTYLLDEFGGKIGTQARTWYAGYYTGLAQYKIKKY